MRVASKLRDYDVRFWTSTDFLAGFESIPERQYVVDANVWRLYGDSFKGVDPARVLVMPAEENRKNLDGVMEVYDALISRAAKKNITLISVGGGIIQDITGFAASTLYRGIRWIYVPTTLLAQADSCIGSKTSLNYKSYKNLVGGFYPPHEVHISTAFLKTLPEDDFYSGLGEVIKLHLMGGEAATEELVRAFPRIKERGADALLAAIRGSLNIKQEFFKDDEFDAGRRNMLNFGHCFGHALESVSGFAIPHGQAVSIGILFANIVARTRGLLAAEKASDLNRRLVLQNVTMFPRAEHLAVEPLFEAMKKDKKRTGEGLALIMMGTDHQMFRVSDLTLPELQAGVRELSLLLSEAPATGRK